MIDQDNDARSNGPRPTEQPSASVSANGAAPEPTTATATTLGSLTKLPRWVAWRPEQRGDRTTKVPYSPHGNRKAEANNPETWGFAWEAFRKYEDLPMPSGEGGIGIMLGRLNDEQAIGGIDLDTCRSPDGTIEDWAQEVIDRFRSYTEVSPSSTGLKIFFVYTPADLPKLRASMTSDWSKIFKRPGDEHPPSIEIHFGNRYFTTTAQGLDEGSDILRHVSLNDLQWVIETAGPTFVGVGRSAQPSRDSVEASAVAGPMTDRVAELCDQYPPLRGLWEGRFHDRGDRSRSTHAMALGSALRRVGCDFDEIRDLLLLHPATAAWVGEKGDADNGRELRRIWEKAEVEAATSEPKEPSLAVLHRTMLPPPSMPIAAFGPVWGEWLPCAATGANAALEYSAMPLLALASALLGNARWVSAWIGWSEPPILWLAGVGDPSSGKTPGAVPVLRDALARVEQWMARNFPAIFNEWLARDAAAAAIRERWEKEVSTAVESGRQPPDVPTDMDAGDEPMQPIVRVGNITIEQMVNILARQPKGLLCANDELAQWFASFQRYTKSNDRPFWLESYTGGFFRLDRVSRPKPVILPHLSVALYGTIQPDRLAAVLRGVDDGLVGRFLWSWPSPLPFRRPNEGANIQAATDALCRLADLAMTEDDDGALRPKVIPLSDPAAEIFESFVGRLGAHESQSHGFMKGAIGKARGQTLRLAIVLEYLWWSAAAHAEPVTIQKRAMEAAIRMMDEYFLPMAARIFSDAAVPADEKNARTLANWIVDTRPEKVNVTDVRDKARLPGLRETADVKAACRFLTEAHWLIEEERSGQRGRPPGNYLVNPRLWEVLDKAQD